MKLQNRQLIWWLGALVLGTVLGLLHNGVVDAVCGFIATVYTRLFQFLAIPTVALAIMTTLILFGKQRSTRKIFLRTITYTLLTTFAAALVGLGLYLLIAPENLPAELISSTGAQNSNTVTADSGTAAYCMKGMRRPRLFLLRSERDAMSGSVTASNTRDSSVMRPSTVKNPPMMSPGVIY